jgi:hypothetical protein
VAFSRELVLVKTKAFKLISTAFLLCVWLAPASLHAQSFETLVNNGDPQNRVDIAFLGDGYTAAEQSKYQADVQNLVQGFFLQQPFLEYQKYFNVHRVDVVSAQSGADHPELNSFVDTALDGSFNCFGIVRLVCANDPKVNDVLNNTLQLAEHDIVVVILNDPQYGGGGGSGVAVISGEQSFIEGLLHEVGHSFGLLGDEYEDDAIFCDTHFEPGFANLTLETERARIKWNSWIDPGTPLPTTSGVLSVPGLYEGGHYCTLGVYRPTFYSKMRALGYPYEQINVEQLVRRIYSFVSSLDSRLPAADKIDLPRGQFQSFNVSLAAPLTHQLTVNWFLDGVPQTSGLSFNLDSSNLSLGNHIVSVSAHDPTEFVRSDPDQWLTSNAVWSINVAANAQIQLDSANYNQSESSRQANVTVTRTGDTSAAASIDYATSDTAVNGCNANDGIASSRCDYLGARGTLHFAANETSRIISIPIVDDSYAENSESFTLTLSDAAGALPGSPATAVITIADDDNVNGPNPTTQAEFFVRQHYLDFLNREPDTAGLNFWSAQITSCGTDQACIELKRINVSAAFFLSIEFQQTGFLVERLYKVAYGDLLGASSLDGTPFLEEVPIVRLNEFLPDTQAIGKGVIIGQPGADQLLENNKQTFLTEFVQRVRFAGAYPAAMTPDQFVDRLNFNAHTVLSSAERDHLVADLTSGAKTRAQVLRAVAENSALVAAETDRAFVLAQFFGYLRRNPNDAPDSDYTGYQFWFGKLFQFNGNFVNAEMVKAFIISGEYRQRFGP